MEVHQIIVYFNRSIMMSLREKEEILLLKLWLFHLLVYVYNWCVQVAKTINSRQKKLLCSSYCVSILATDCIKISFFYEIQRLHKAQLFIFTTQITICVLQFKSGKYVKIFFFSFISPPPKYSSPKSNPI